VLGLFIGEVISSTKIELYTVLILVAWPVLVLISYWYWSVGILVGMLSTKEFGGNCLRFGGKPFFP
jgi:hypothetical protein